MSSFEEKVLKNNYKKNTDKFNRKLEKILNQEHENFLNNNKIDFFLKNQDYEKFTKVFKSFINNRFHSIFVIGCKG
ncbi:hypothetical protein, partial [Candidatus Mycoplasma haematominutum]|uniref:hypothetical protein n=1 Tax=Candidatus Mycoplasma haematominutum TaxID=209446 RepID=UPI0005C6E377